MTLTRWKCTFYLCFPTLAALDSKRILSESASLHIVHKCTKMYLLTVPPFNRLHFHRPQNCRHVLAGNNTVWAQPSYWNTNKHLGADKLGGMTDWMRWNYCEQVWNIWKSFLKWRFPWRCCHGCLSSLFSSQRTAKKKWEQPKSYALEIGLLCLSFTPISIWTRSPFWHHEYPARLLSGIQNDNARWQSFCFFGEEFHWDRMHYGSSSNDQ